MSDYWTCNDCNNYDCDNTNWRGWGYCTERCTYYPKSDRACNRFVNKPDYVSSCFLTTTICNIFGFEDDCYGLNVMRNFRDTILVKDAKYYPLLAEYDVVGPIISARMYNDDHRDEVAYYYFENYIYDIIMNLSTERDYDTAVEKYIEMVNDMKRMYGITKDITDRDVDNLARQINNNQYKVKKRVKNNS